MSITQVLRGKIVHRFKLPLPEKNHRGKEGNSNSFIRFPEDGAENKDVTSSQYKQERCLVDHYTTHLNQCGFIFIPDAEILPHKEYLISLPKRLLKLACDAVRTERRVIVRRYKVIPFLKNIVIPTCDDITAPTLTPTAAHAMIEIHELELSPKETTEIDRRTDTNLTSHNTEKNESNLWTLTQFWRKELLDFQKMKNSRPKFSLLATIDAISPVVTVDPSNPFALVEVYDRENIDVTCIVVLYGNRAVLNHAAMHPLDTIVFRNVVYKPWAIHKVLNCNKDDTDSTIHQKFAGRVPSHVFVAMGVECVSWSHSDKSQPTLSHRNIHSSGLPQNQRQRPQNEMPPTVTPIHLTTILGKINDVKTVSVSFNQRTATVIHYIDIILLNQSTDEYNEKSCNSTTNSEPLSGSRRCRLYLSYFPMSVALQCSLRRDAIVQADNIQVVHSQKNSNSDDCFFDKYVACLRSTVILLKHATDVFIPSAEKKQEPMKKMTRNEKHSSQHSTVDKRISLSIQPSQELSIPIKRKARKLQSRRFKVKGQRKTGLEASFEKNASNKKECLLVGIPITFINCGFRRIIYPRETCFERIGDWERRSFQLPSKMATQNDCSPECVPRAWIADVLMGGKSSNSNAKDKFGIYRDRSDDLNRKVHFQDNRRAPIRSPYAEFFDYSFCLPTHDKEMNMKVQKQNSFSEFSKFVELDRIRIASQKYFENHMLRLLSHQATSQKLESLHKIRMGFHGSIRVPLQDLFTHYREEDDILIGGFVSELHMSTLSVASIADGMCQIPISFEKNYCRADINDFIIGQFNGVMISCLCLGSTSTSDFQTKNPKFASLPSLHSRGKKLLGNCSLTIIDSFLFATAFQLQCREPKLHKMSIGQPMEHEGKAIEDVALTIEHCLETKEFLSKSSKEATVVGMVTRCRFHSKTNTDGSQEFCRLSVSSFKNDQSKDIGADSSCLQALELAVSVVKSTARMVKIDEVVATWPEVNLNGSQMLIASSFWVLGDSGRTCAMTFGGSDDFIQGSSCSNSITKITFPRSTMQLNKSGYVRCFGSHNSMDAIFENGCYLHESETNESLEMNLSTKSFDFVGGSSVMAGLLHRRPSRRNVFRRNMPLVRSVGELSATPSNAIPSTTLSKLFQLLFQGLREPNTSHVIMNPSLVRRISNGRILSVSFCKVQCYCTRCFCALASPPADARKKFLKSSKRKREDSFGEPSFWHLPRPGDPAYNNSTTNCKTEAIPRHIKLSKLRCPKGACSQNVFGVRWECSGILDDGTGQATIYADGDAALTLLGMSAEAIQTIEEDIWSIEYGSIQFMKSIPPPTYLRDKVINILFSKRTQDLHKGAMIDPLRLLSSQERAVYLLERNCRSSRPRRHLDYYVRCKPFLNKSKMVFPLSHTMIDSFFGNNLGGNSILHRGKIASYSVPSLKLELVDCGIHSSESYNYKNK